MSLLDFFNRVRFVVLGGVAVMAVACSDSVSAPRSHPAAEAAPSKVGIKPDNAPVTDWYNCASWDNMETWDCEYVGTTGSYYYDPNYFGGYDYVSHVDCSTSPVMCPSSYPYSSGGFYGMTAAQPASNDNSAAAIPTCPPAPSDTTANAWCSGVDPAGYRLSRIQSALTAMHAKGGICDSLATIGDSLINGHRLKLYTRSGITATFSGGAPQGGGATGPKSYMVVSLEWTDLGWDRNHTTVGEPIRRDLSQLLAHELDHLHGSTPAHTDQAAYMTPHSQTCSDL